VNSSQESAALVGIYPLIVNVGSASSPQFVFRLSLSALSLVRSYINSDMIQPGFRMDLGNLSWFLGFSSNVTQSLTIDSATLTNDSLSVTVTNSGNQVQTIRFVEVTPSLFASGPPGMQPMYRLPGFLGSLTFAVEPNGSLQPIVMATTGMAMGSLIASKLEAGGFNLTAGASATFSYHGALSLTYDSTGIGMGLGGGNLTVTPPIGGITSPSVYQITVIGDTASASISVKA